MRSKWLIAAMLALPAHSVIAGGHPGAAEVRTHHATEAEAITAGRDQLLKRRETLAPGGSLTQQHSFPGGKVEAGERPEQTLIRELKEELGITVTEACIAPLTFASHGYPDFHLLMPLYVCRRWEGAVTPKEGQNLAWVRPNRLRDYDMPPADVPLISHLAALL